MKSTGLLLFYPAFYPSVFQTFVVWVVWAIALLAMLVSLRPFRAGLGIEILAAIEAFEQLIE